MGKDKSFGVRAGTYAHWTCFALAWAEERGLAPVTRKDLFEQMGERFHQQRGNQVMRELHEDGLVDREREVHGNAYLYELKEDGKEMVKELGVPETHPGVGRTKGDEVEKDLSLPSVIAEFESSEEEYPEPETPDKFQKARSRWDRYDEWIEENFDLDEDDEEWDPVESFEEGHVLVRQSYLEEVKHERKLHAYEPTNGAFMAMCGRDVATKTSLSPMHPDDFKRDTAHCEVCATLLDVEGPERNAQKVKADPFGVFSDESEFEEEEVAVEPEPAEPPKLEVVEETEDEDEEKEVIGTISLEPEWDWVGLQLFKLGRKQQARRAFREDMVPIEVYGPGGVQDLIYEAYWQNVDADLDLGSPFPDALTVQELPYDKEEARQAKKELGLIETDGDEEEEESEDESEPEPEDVPPNVVW